MEEGQKEASMATLQPSCQMRSCSQSQVRDHPHNEALWESREAHWWVLEAACMQELNIDRLNWEADDIPH